MKKIAVSIVALCLIGACVTKEDLDPEVIKIPEKVVPITDFMRLSDSPACVVAEQNFISIQTTHSLAFDYGITGDLDISSSIFSQSLNTHPYFESYINAGDYSGNGRIRLSFGTDNSIETGIYYTYSSGYEDEYTGKKYVSISIEEYNYWSRPTLYVKSGQKVLVVVNKNRTRARIKFCNADLDFKTVNNSGNITGEIDITLD